MENTRVVSTSEGVIEAYGRGRARRWRWAARVRVDGKSVQYRRRGFNTREDALADRDRVLEEIRDPDATKPVEVLTFSAALDRLLAEKSRHKSAAEYRRVAGRLVRAFGKDTPLVDLTASRISAWRAERLAATSSRTGKPLSIASINRPLAVLRHLLKRAHEEWGVIASAPRVRLEKEDQGRLRWLTHEEATRLLEATSKSRNPGLHDLVILSLGTGVRRSEAFGLTWERVDRARGVIRLEITKSGKRREVPFDADVDAMFARRVRPSGKVFASGNWNSYRSAFETCVAHAKLDDFRWHDLRHTYASWAVQQGRPINEVKDLLGHATLAMTMRYAHLAPEQGRQAAAAVGAVLSKALAARSTTMAPAPIEATKTA